ncbi:tetratricopeptide repeat protein [Nonomuraea phyllanthi]|uniref:Tetratricopeptide repeat protein n=1 Tax=Nonomuraea phyllanthi TaxID=2219224 RepID=A0A5C4V2N1_9ACTN|nr:tetratricopeptide repeat protein [Nonomuraea phyllanthi]
MLALHGDERVWEWMRLMALERPKPAQLPSAIATFTGREAEVERLCALLADGAERVVAISGPAGIGKSALALQVAHHISHHFPDGQLYVNLQGSAPGTDPLPPAEVLGRFLRSMGVAAPAALGEQEEAVATFRSLTHGKRLLVLLDNAASAEQVRHLLPGSATCGVLITSRRMLSAIDAASHCQLRGLSRDEAGALLARLLGADRLDREAEAVAEVIPLCGELPLALSIVAARLRGRPDLPVRALADRLAGEQRRLAELEIDDQAVRASFLVSYEDLGDGPAARLFRLLGLLDGPDFGVPVAAALAELPEGRTAALLDQLLENQLVVSDAPGRYHMHDLLRLLARELATEQESEQARASAVRRALHCHLATARRAALSVEPMIAWRIDFVPDALVHPGVPLESVEAVNTWLDTEIENLVAAARQAVTSADPAIAAYLSACLNTPLEQRARWGEQLALGRLALEAAGSTGDLRQAGLGHNDLGWALHALGKPAEALASFDRALDAWRPIGYDTGQALALNGRGAALRSLERHEESLAALEQARTMWHRSGHARHEASCLTGIGLTRQRLGRHDEAVAAHREALSLARESDARVTEVMALGNLGEAHRLAGQVDEAVTCFQEALCLDRRRGLSGTYWEAEHLWGLGRATGDRACLNRSAAILHELGLITYREARAIGLDADPATPDAISRQL